MSEPRTFFRTRTWRFRLVIVFIAVSATILPLATAFYVCEAFGFEAGINKKINEAPQFYALFTFIILVAMIIILIPNAPLIAITIWSQIINAILLPVVLISMITMVNNKKIMGNYTNNAFQNTVGWSSTVILIMMTIMLIISPLVNYLHKFFFRS